MCSRALGYLPFGLHIVWYSDSIPLTVMHVCFLVCGLSKRDLEKQTQTGRTTIPVVHVWPHSNFDIPLLYTLI